HVETLRVFPWRHLPHAEGARQLRDVRRGDGVARREKLTGVRDGLAVRDDHDENRSPFAPEYEVLRRLRALVEKLPARGVVEREAVLREVFDGRLLLRGDRLLRLPRRGHT